MADHSADSINEQLERILASPRFKGSPRLSDFLRYVVTETLGGRGDRIKQYTVGVEGLGYEAGFDPGSDPNVRVHARQLRRALEEYYETHGRTDVVRIEIPVGSYVPEFGENQVALDTAGSSEGVAALPDRQPADASVPSVAVVTLDCLDREGDAAYIASGLTEDLVVSLTRFPYFEVIGPLSRARLRADARDASEIGRAYGVRFVLDGSVRTQGRDLRMTVRLTDAASGSNLWGESLQCDRAKIWTCARDNDLADQIAAALADDYGVIPLVMGKRTASGTPENASAYEALLRSYHYLRTLTEEDRAAALAALEEALRRDPDNPEVLGRLGDLLCTAYQLGYVGDDEMDRAEEMARKAVLLDPNTQVTRYTIAMVHYLRYRKDLYLVEAEHVLRLNPNHAQYVASVGGNLAMMGYWDRGLDLMSKAMRLNPHHPGWYHYVPFMDAYRRGEYDRAWTEAQLFNAPGLFLDPLFRAATLGQLDRRRAAGNAIEELLSLRPDFREIGRTLMRRLIYTEENAELLIAGLRKAGLDDVAEETPRG